MALSQSDGLITIRWPGARCKCIIDIFIKEAAAEYISCFRTLISSRKSYDTKVVMSNSNIAKKLIQIKGAQYFSDTIQSNE